MWRYNFVRLLGVALKTFRFGGRKFRRGAKKKYVDKVTRLIKVQEMRRFLIKNACLQ